MDPYIKRHKDWVKRANAFKSIIFPAAKRRIILQMNYGYPYLAQQTLFSVLKVLKTFVRKIIKAENAKAFYIVKKSFIEFLFDIGFDPKNYGDEDKVLNLLLE